MTTRKRTLAAGHVHLFHIVAPIVARARGYFADEGVDECEFFCSGSDAETRLARDAALWEGKYHMIERIPQDGSVNQAGLQLVIDEEKAAGKLPAEFGMQEILADVLVREAVQSVNQRFGSGCELERTSRQR